MSCVGQAQTCGGIKLVNCFHNDIIHFSLGKHININKTKGERVPQDYLPNCKQIFFNYYFTEGYLLFWSKTRLKHVKASKRWKIDSYSNTE